LSSNKKGLLSHWLGAKQETGIKNQLIIRETEQKNALLSITIQQLDDGAERGFIRVRGNKKFSRALCPHPSGSAKNVRRIALLMCV
jgi:hypothetical protein